MLRLWLALPSLRRSNLFHGALRCALLLSALLLITTPSFCAGPSRPVKVLMLFYGDKDSPAFAEFQNGFRARMESELNVPVWIYEESFDEGWLGHDPAHERTAEMFLRDKYAGRGIDVIVPFGIYPFEFVQKRRKILLPEAKLIYFLLGHSPPQSMSEATGLVLELNLAPTLEVALSQNPESRHVLLIAGSTALDRAMAQLFLSSGMKFLQERHSNVDLQVIPPGTFEETHSLLAALPRDTITIYVIYHGDSAGQSFVPARILTTFSTISNRPMYSWLDTCSGRGIVGGSLANAQMTGAELGNLAVRVVRGEQPGNIPEVSSSFRRNEFDWRQMKRWGIGMDKVPAGSIIINREYTVWEMYKWRIAGLLVLLAIAATLVGALVRLTIAQRRNLKKLTYRGKLEALVAQFAAAFINLRADLAAMETGCAFRRLLEFFDLDEINLFEFRGEMVQLRVLCSRTAPGIEEPPALDLHHPAPADWQILRDAPIVARNPGQLAEEAGGLKEVLRGRGFRSLATFPLRCDENTFAVLSFSTVRNEREWDPDILLTLGTIADIFGGALERQHAEEAERASRDQLIDIIESAMDGIIAVDSQQRIVVFNTAAERIFGCPIGEALGQPLERFIPLCFRVQHQHGPNFAEMSVTNRAEGAPGALRGLRAAGEEFPIEVSISRVETGGGTLFTIIIRDITERERAQQALRETEDRFRLVANTAPVLIWMSGPDKLCTYFNQAWLDFTGRRLEDELGNGWAEGVHSGDLEKCLATYTQAFDLRQPFRMEYRLRAHDGRFRWILDAGVPRVNADGSFAGYIGSCMDLTERKEVEEALYRSEQLKASILGSLRNHVVVLDSEGMVLASNKQENGSAAESCFPGEEHGQSPARDQGDLQKTGRDASYLEMWLQRQRAGDPVAATAVKGIRDVCEGARDYCELEYRDDSKPGADQRWILMSVTRLQGGASGAVISHQDITEQIKHRQAIQEFNGRLINAQEQERSRIARELHDDINQQLAILAIELQQLEMSLPANAFRDRRKVQELWNKTRALSTDLQHLSHELHSSKLQHLGITAALRGLCGEVSEQHKIGVNFQFQKVPAMDPNVSLSLFRVAQESLHNIAKHSRAKKVQVELIGGGERVLLRVSDDGVGFDPGASRHQAGLGIISMGERIRLVGGTLSVKSKPSMGAQIEAVIPLSNSPAIAGRVSMPPVPSSKAG